MIFVRSQWWDVFFGQAGSGRKLCKVVALAALTLATTPCSAGGIFYFLPYFEDGHPVALERAAVVSSRSRVVVSDAEMEYVLDQTFYNNNEQTLEGVFLLPYDPSSPPERLSIVIDRAAVAPERLAPEQFLPLLFEFTRGIADPCLLELAGKGAFVVRRLRLGPKKEKSIQTRFFIRKTASEDFMQATVPLWGERYSLGPVAGLEILVRFKMSIPIRAVFSFTHEISLLREAPHRVTASFRSQHKPVRQDFSVVAALRGTDFAARMLCQKTSEGGGVFMTILCPPLAAQRQQSLPKDVVFAVDISGSIPPAMRELSHRLIISGLQRLGEQDRFNIVAIGTKTGLMQKGLAPSMPENLTEAVRYLNTLEYGGGTDLFNGVMTCLDQFSPSRRQRFVVLITDGKPTVGNLDPQGLINAVRQGNRLGAKIFSAALGDGADTALLWQLSEMSRGAAVHIHGVGPFEGEINRFYEGINQPVVRNISLQLEGASQADAMPSVIPDMSGEAPAFVFGSYDQRKTGAVAVGVKALVQGRSQTLSRSCDPSASSRIKPNILLVYAMRKMAKLMEDERQKGFEAGGSATLRALAEEYGFKRPTAGRYPAREWGRLYWLYQTSLVPRQVESEDFRRVGEKLFRREGGEWVDVSFQPVFETTLVHFLSERYFELIRERPWLGQYFALGQNVTLAVDSKAIKVEAGVEGVQPSEGDHAPLK
ncbi:MAG: vWA domain-containing protein [Desulfomonilaceae bacterium]